MPPTYRAHTTNGGPQATSITLSQPTGTAAGDILIARVSIYRFTTAAVTITAPSGFTLITAANAAGDGGNHRIYTYWKRATASEPASYTWSWGSNEYQQGFLAAYSQAVASGDPIDAAGTPASGNGSTATANGLTTTLADCTILNMVTNVNENIVATPPTGMTERLEFLQLYLSDEVVAAAGATGTRSTSITSGSDPWTAALIALAPAAGGGAAAGDLILPAPNRQPVMAHLLRR